MVAHRMTDQIIIISVSVSWDDDVDYADNVMGYSSLDPATTTRVSELLFVRWRRTINSCMSNDEWKHFPRQPEPERTVATTCCAAGIAKAASATTWRGWLRIAISIPNVHGRGHIKGYYHRRWGRCSRGWYGSDIIVVAASNEDEWFRIGCHPVLQRIGYVSPVEDFYFFTYELHFVGWDWEPHHFCSIVSFPSSPDRWTLWSGTIIKSGWEFICNYWIRGDAHFVVIAGGSHDIRIIDIVSLRQWRSPICELISRWIYLSMMWSLDLTSCHDCWILDRGSVWWSMGSTCGISRYVLLGHVSMDYVFTIHWPFSLTISIHLL